MVNEQGKELTALEEAQYILSRPEYVVSPGAWRELVRRLVDENEGTAQCCGEPETCDRRCMFVIEHLRNTLSRYQDTSGPLVQELARLRAENEALRHELQVIDEQGIDAFKPDAGDFR